MQTIEERNEFFTFMRIVVYLAHNHGYKLYRTKLYKLIFLAQLFYSSKYDKQLFTQPFIKSMYHIKLQNIDNYLETLEEMGVIRTKQESTGVVIRCNIDPVNSLYSKEELFILKHLIKYYSNLSSKDIEQILNICQVQQNNNLENYCLLYDINKISTKSNGLFKYLNI